MTVRDSTISNLEKDILLWREMKDGSRVAFQELFDTHSDRLFDYGLTITPERELVKDCVQDLFVTIWTNRENISVARSVKYYMFFSLRRLILKKVGRAKRFFSLSAFNNLGFVTDVCDQSFFKAEAFASYRTILLSAVDDLPARQKEIIFLKFYEDLKNDEIEKIMNVNNQVVRNTLCKALRNLRRKISKSNSRSLNNTGTYRFLPKTYQQS